MKLKITNIRYDEDYKKVAPRNLPSSLEVEVDAPLQAALNSPAKRDFAAYFAIGKALGTEAANAVITADAEIID